jgi:hypothetical protein
MTIEPHLVGRIMCAVYSKKTIPVELQATREAIEQFASAFANGRKWQVWLVLQIGRRKFLLGLLNSGSRFPVARIAIRQFGVVEMGDPRMSAMRVIRA